VDRPHPGIAGETKGHEPEVGGEADDDDPSGAPRQYPAAAGVVDEDGRLRNGHSRENARRP
jgi:hypothetical protein